MRKASKNMMKQLSIEELVDIYLNSDGETEKTACSEIEDRYWEEYEVRREILLKLVASEKDNSWRLVVALPPVWGDDYIDVFRAMAEDDILTWVKRWGYYWPELGMEAKRILEQKHPQIYTFNHYYSFSDAAYFLLFSCCVTNSDFAINKEVVCQVTDCLAEYNSAERRSMRVPIEDCPVYEMVEDVYSRMTQDLDRGRYNEVTPLEAWQEYKRSMEKPLSLNSELMKKMLGMYPELKYLVGDIDDCQQEDADAPVQGEDPDATIFIEQFFQTDNDVPF